MGEERERVRRALDFMKETLGLRHSVVAPLLKRLLKVYANEWRYIEEENYRVLADSYFEHQEAQLHKKIATKSHERVATRNMSRSPKISHEAKCMEERKNEHVPVSVPTFAQSSTGFKLETISYREVGPGGKQIDIDRKETLECNQNKNIEYPVVVCEKEEIKSEDQLLVNMPMTKCCTKLESFDPQTVEKQMTSGPCLLHCSHEASDDQDLRSESLKTIGDVTENGRSITDCDQQQTEMDSLRALAGTYSSISDEAHGHFTECDTAATCDSMILKGSFKGKRLASSTISPTFQAKKARTKSPFPVVINVKKEFSDTGNFSGSSCSKVEQNSLALVIKQEPYFWDMSACLQIQQIEVDQVAQVSGNFLSLTWPERERRQYDANDISRGEEKVPITVDRKSPIEKLPEDFFYISKNITYQNAYVNFALARIGDDSCCASCNGDCLKSPYPCACAQETGGLYAYTGHGLIREDFLTEILNDKRNHESSKRLFYCGSGYICPVERIKNESNPAPCKGHPMRKFVKECWSKCGCSMHCSNRVVQRGINYKLQVFFTPAGKGWGVRTLEAIPKGAFVCEYVGEILTNIELDARNSRAKEHAAHYPVLLDADWGSENVLKDEEALCLDATKYGNVARFINHRCYDANLVDVPVEIETPDHHYYHIAFFTVRAVEPWEELTWDYCIDFEDNDHPIKAFQCYCGSVYCRGKRP